MRPEVTQRKTPARLHQEIETMEKALKAREKQQGASIEQIMEELAVRKKTVTDAVEVVNGLNELILVRLPTLSLISVRTRGWS